MKKTSNKSHFMIFTAIFVLMSLSKDRSELLRGTTAAFMGSLWENATNFRSSLGDFFGFFFHVGPPGPSLEEINQLQLKNQRLESELRKVHSLLGGKLTPLFASDFDFIPSKVIFRSPSTWNSSLWINVGQEDNKKQGKEIIIKNSPVVIGKSVVGVIDYVGKKQSRVRLITDSGLRLSVRVKRKTDKGILFLAKGELHGSSQPLWRTEAQRLYGLGFNYDFSDSHGAARDLRTGQKLNPTQKNSFLPLIQLDDLLVTSGLDGIFPEGLEVAHVTKVMPLKEGDYYFEIEAKPAIGHSDDLSLLFVLAPLGYDPLDDG